MTQFMMHAAPAFYGPVAQHLPTYLDHASFGNHRFNQGDYAVKDHAWLDHLGVRPEHRYPETVHTPITGMIDSATESLTSGAKYLEEHPTPVDAHSILQFIDDTISALAYYRTVSVYGGETRQFLTEIQSEMSSVMTSLKHGHTEQEHVVAKYLSSALDEVDVACYLEENQYWPDGVPMLGADGEYVANVRYHDKLPAAEHYGTTYDTYIPQEHDIAAPYIKQKQTAHDLSTSEAVAKYLKDVHHTAGYMGYHHGEASKHYIHHSLKNGIDLDSNDASNDASNDLPSLLEININGPVIISGDGSTNLGELLRSALQEQMPAPAPAAVEEPELLSLAGYNNYQTMGSMPPQQSYQSSSSMRRTQSAPARYSTAAPPAQPQQQPRRKRDRFYSVASKAREYLGYGAMGAGGIAMAVPITAPVMAPVASGLGIASGVAAGAQGAAALAGGGPNSHFDQAGYVQGIAGGAQALAHAVPGLGPAVGVAAGATSAATGLGRAGYTGWQRLRNRQRPTRQDMMQMAGDAYGGVTGGRYDATGGVGPTDAMSGAFVRGLL